MLPQAATASLKIKEEIKKPLRFLFQALRTGFAFGSRIKSYPQYITEESLQSECRLVFSLLREVSDD